MLKGRYSLQISYKVNPELSIEQVLSIYDKSGLSRPKDTRSVMNMIKNAQVIVTAWEGQQLVGFLRALTDFSFDCYINDLAVDKDYQHHGIGRELVLRLMELLDEKTLVFLISTPQATNFYTKMSFQNDFERLGEPLFMVVEK